MNTEIQALNDDQIEEVGGGILVILALFAVAYQIGYERAETRQCPA